MAPTEAEKITWWAEHENEHEHEVDDEVDEDEPEVEVEQNEVGKYEVEIADGK